MKVLLIRDYCDTCYRDGKKVEATVGIATMKAILHLCDDHSKHTEGLDIIDTWKCEQSVIKLGQPQRPRKE